MGLLVDGVWRDRWYDTRSTGGRFVRAESAFRSWITADGRPGPSGEGGFKAEAGRYHLYVSYACPWAHWTLIFRALKGLIDAISVTVVEPLMLEGGWEIAEGADPVDGAFADVGAAGPDYYPDDLRGAIEAVNAVVYETVNNGVYKAGFATSQQAYEEAFDALFATLDDLDARLGGQRYLAGDRITEADWRLFTTLVRFDPVYHGHFKCNRRRLVDYPNLWPYTRELYQVPGIAETVRMDHIKTHYYASHRTVNPTGIVPRGSDIDFMTPHNRGG